MIRNLTIALLLFFAVAGVAQSPFDTTRYGRNEAVGHFINTRGFRMYYETYGKGEPMLIIHGNGGSIRDFTYQIPEFSKQYRLIIADSRAHGKSTDDRDSLSYEMMTDDLNALLDSLHLDSVNVIGWSDGGIEALLLAIRHPSKVKKMAFTGANLWPDTTAVDPPIHKMVMDWNLAMAKEKQTPELKHQRKLARLLSFEPHITTAQLKTISCPTLVIGGDHDVIRTEHTMLIAKSIPKSYLWILPDSGHATPVVYHEDFNKVVSRFFAKPYRKIEGEARFN